MASLNQWLERLTLKDALNPLSTFVSRWTPKAPSSDAFSPQSFWNAAWTSCTVLGAAVFVSVAPLLCALAWHRLRAMRSNNSIRNTAVFITGCDSGIGLETAVLLSAEHPSVYVFAGCLSTAGELRLASLNRSNLIPLKLDVTSDGDVQAALNFVRSKLGQMKIYALIHNAGIFDGSFFEVTPVEIYQRVMDVHFMGAVRVTKAFLGLMEKGEREWGGRVVMISSVGGIMASPGSTAYCAAKHALAAFADGLRQEVKELGIKVIQVIPGPVKSGALRQIPISANALLSAAPHDVFQRYGGQSFVTAYAEFFSNLYNHAVPPVHVASSIQKAILARYPKDLYYEVDSIYPFLTVCPHYLRDFLMDPRNFRNQIIREYVR